MRNKKKIKLLKERPEDLRISRSGKKVPEEDLDWEFDLKRWTTSEEEVDVGSAVGGEPESSLEEADYEITYRFDQREEQKGVQDQIRKGCEV